MAPRADITKQEAIMLVLSRKDGQRVCIGEHIVIMVVRARGGRVQLGIEAPQSEVVLRGELERNGNHDAKRTSNTYSQGARTER